MVTQKAPRVPGLWLSFYFAYYVISLEPAIRAWVTQSGARQEMCGCCPTWCQRNFYLDPVSPPTKINPENAKSDTSNYSGFKPQIIVQMQFQATFLFLILSGTETKVYVKAEAEAGKSLRSVGHCRLPAPVPTVILLKEASGRRNLITVSF